MFRLIIRFPVLILIIMEDTLRAVTFKFGTTQEPVVLILIIMEDTLRAGTCPLDNVYYSVLILIIMEDTLRGHMPELNIYTMASLNPYYNGRYSTSM